MLDFAAPAGAQVTPGAVESFLAEVRSRGGLVRTGKLKVSLTGTVLSCS